MMQPTIWWALVTAVASAPCDILDAAGAQCVCAHSLTRALYSAYQGPLYEIRRSSDNATTTVTAGSGGAANASIQDAFCISSDCVITRIFDQSPCGNHLGIAPGGGAAPGPDQPVNASALPVRLGTHRVYGGWFAGRMGYRNDTCSSTATGNDPQVIYMVTSGLHFNGDCCFDYGNAETNAHDQGPGTMEAVYFGNDTRTGRGGGAGPWVMADLEAGLWPGINHTNPSNAPITAAFVTAMLKGGTDGFVLKGGDATSGPLRTIYAGPRPAGYQPMKKQGAVILGIGGDNSDRSIGTFFEGIMTASMTSDAVDDAVQADIIAAGYAML